MEWHFNELSINGQFKDADDFREKLSPLLKFRQGNEKFKNNFFCSRMIGERKAVNQESFKQTLRKTNDRNFRRLTFEWLDRSGPYWDGDNRTQNKDDYFEFEGHDVTDQGLGEAARRKLVGSQAAVFSFLDGSISFDRDPLLVQQGLPEDPIASAEVGNFWKIVDVEKTIHSCTVPENWVDMDAEIRRRFANLSFSREAVSPLKGTPFNRQVCERIFELLKVLDQIVEESDERGRLSTDGKEILENHFKGEKSWFSDESKTNLHNFKNEMTFPDPDDEEKTMFCSWHAKINTPQTRIHFLWPRPNGEKVIKIGYIGPKITKG